MQRAQVVLRAALARLGAIDRSDALALVRLTHVVARSLTVDAHLSTDDLVTFIRSLHGRRFVDLRLPVQPAVRDGAAVLTTSAASPELRRWLLGGADQGTQVGPQPAAATHMVVPTPC